MHEKNFWDWVVFYGISTFVGYSMSNSTNRPIRIVGKEFVNGPGTRVLSQDESEQRLKNGT